MPETLTEMLIRHEGLRLKPYRCTAGKLTIGVGRNLEDVGISEDEAIHLLNNDIDKCIEYTNQFDWFNDLCVIRQDVVINMIFNLGISRFLGFKKLIKALSVGNYELASYEMLDSRWARQVGSRATELAKIMKEGK
jgi:lysozyme